MKIILFFLMFFTISALLIISNNNLEMYKEKNIENFFGDYFEWVDDIYLNTQTITGNIIKLDWLPETKS